MAGSRDRGARARRSLPHAGVQQFILSDVAPISTLAFAPEMGHPTSGAFCAPPPEPIAHENLPSLLRRRRSRPRRRVLFRRVRLWKPRQTGSGATGLRRRRRPREGRHAVCRDRATPREDQAGEDGDHAKDTGGAKTAPTSQGGPTQDSGPSRRQRSGRRPDGPRGRPRRTARSITTAVARATGPRRATAAPRVTAAPGATPASTRASMRGPASTRASTWEAPPPNQCVPLTCIELGAHCGPQGDGCGEPHLLRQLPGARDLRRRRLAERLRHRRLGDGGVCQPKTCADWGATCGPVSDGCGGLVQCGTCTAPADLRRRRHAERVRRRHRLRPRRPAPPRTSTAARSATAAAASSSAAPAPRPQTCGGGGTPSECGTLADAATAAPVRAADLRRSSASTAARPATAAAGCSTAAPAPRPQTCGGGGLPSVCGGNTGCVPDDLRAARLQLRPGRRRLRRRLQCGTCTAPQTCGGGGTPGVCGGCRAACRRPARSSASTAARPATAAAGSSQCGTLHGARDLRRRRHARRLRARAGRRQHELHRPLPPAGDLPGHGVTTTVSRHGLAPNGTDPLYNALVYVPNGGAAPTYGVTAFTAGVHCGQCGERGDAARRWCSTLTGVDGTFTLQNVPVGSEHPAGDPARPLAPPGHHPHRRRLRQHRARLAYTGCRRPAGSARTCRGTQASERTTSRSWPSSTGSVDALECVLRKIGIDRTEFSDPLHGRHRPRPALQGRRRPRGGNHLGGDTAGRTSSGAARPRSTSTTWSTSPARANEYQKTAAQQHRHQLHQRRRAHLRHPLQLRVVSPTTLPLHRHRELERRPGDSPTDQDRLHQHELPRGQALAQWLQTVGASTTYAQMPLNTLRYDFNGVVRPTLLWVSLGAPPTGA